MITSRRAFLVTTGLAAFAAPLQALRARIDGGFAMLDVGYGRLRAARDATTGLPLLELPDGFRYLTFGWSGDAMDDGTPTPPLHDGMAAFAGENGMVVLVRNHEVSAAPAFGDTPYDPQAGGGTTTIVFDPKAERVVGMQPSLTGTFRNCAGGPTPWGSWLTCEETVIAPGPKNPTTRQHGYIFEVPAAGVSNAEPLKAMGCFVHEAIAIDPATGLVYETEDRARAGLYRFTPKTPRRLADGGRLQMLAIDGRPRLDTSRGQREGVTYGVHWVDIPEPDRPHVNAAMGDANGVLMQGLDRGGAVFSRLEGAWFGDGRLFITATDGGDARMGQVWELDPGRERLRLLFESPGPHLLNMPDNLCLSPRGGLAICEDGTTIPSLQALTRDGRIVRFARNNVRLAGERNGIAGNFTMREMAGVTYSPDGRWLFFNIQSPGITFAVTGPWSDEGL
ncbi:MAG: alkaline phosphatase PhoX [Vicinamibacterales bacterium]